MNIKNHHCNNFLNKKLFVLTLLMSCSLLSMAQPFKADIAAFVSMDSIVAPPQGKILLAGSSSFTKWKDINQYFPGYPIINRGFGGSNLLDLTNYVQETILKYNPKQIFIYCGENDLAGSDTVTPQMVLARFTNLYKIIYYTIHV